jgi:LmeA-like phospholipid-binding
MRKLLIGVAVLIVLLVAADRIGVAVAENQIAQRLQTAYGLPAKPGVSITGFPFLTQVAAGDYAEIDVSVGQVQADGTTLHDLTVKLTGVHASIPQVLGSGASTVTADQAAGSAVVGFAAVEQRLPHGFRLASDGKNLRVSGKVNYHGIRVPVTATVALRVTGSGIRVTPVDVTIPGGISPPVSAYSSKLGVTIPLNALPLHLHLTWVHVTSNGVRVGAAASNVQFART